LKDYLKGFLEEYPESPHSQDVLLSFFHNMCSHSEATRLEQHILERWWLLDGALCKVVDLHEALASHATADKLDFMLQRSSLLCVGYACYGSGAGRVRFWECHLTAACGIS
jgi:hypothetical protein